MKLIKRTLLLCCIVSLVFAQAPIKLSVKLGGHTQHNPFRAAVANGWAADARFSYELNHNFDLSFDVAYDHTILNEDSVILEWDWAYWDERYIDWLLTGASKEEVDSISTILEYWRPDSSYHGVFTPVQWMNEIRLTLAADYKLPLNDKMSLFGSIGAGMSIYTRRLMVVEDWMKVFTWEWDSVAVAEGTLSDDEYDNYQIFMGLHQDDPETYQLDTLNSIYHLQYDNYAQVSHFAPDKKGLKFYLTPSIGFRYALREDIDLECAYQGIFYLNVNDAIMKETFPVKSKSMLWLGLTFKY